MLSWARGGEWEVVMCPREGGVERGGKRSTREEWVKARGPRKVVFQSLLGGLGLPERPAQMMRCFCFVSKVVVAWETPVEVDDTRAEQSPAKDELWA